MELGAIIYYYPMGEEDLRGGRRAAAKRHWFQEAALALKRLGEDQVMGCAVPPFYYKKKPWKAQTLSEAMEAALCHAQGMTDTYAHPQIEAMLTEEYCRRWRPRQATVQMILKSLIEQEAEDVLRHSGAVTVLLGESADTDWQMKMTRELLQPYLPRINKLLICYEELAQTDVFIELEEYLDEYYYEYGLVPQLEPYHVNQIVASSAYLEEGQTSLIKRNSNLRCGRMKCDGMILDYAADYRYPKILPESAAVYIDTVSTVGKEQMLKRKTPQIPYVSPLKYLDTMVKNSYDELL